MNTVTNNYNVAEDIDNTESIKDSCVMSDTEAKIISASADNDNGNDTPPTSPASALEPISKEDTSLNEENINTAIKEYGLLELVYTTLPPSQYKSVREKSVSESILKLKYDQILHDVFKNIPKRQGSRKEIGKQKLIEMLYGLNRYQKEQIEKADFSYMDKAIQQAKENQEPTSINKMMKIKKDEELAQKAEAKRLKKEAEEAELVKKLDEAKKANPDEVFDAALIDLPLAPKDFDFSSLSLPLTDDALLLVAVEADDMVRGLEFIKHQNAVYKTNFIWDRDRIFVTGEWCKNRHTMFLLAVKGDPERPHNTFKAESVFFEHQSSATHYVPDYFYELIENMCLGKQYLEVFSNRQFSDSWHILDTKTNNLTNGEK